MPGCAIVWFRRDLRVHDHPALHRAVAEHDRVVPVFVVDDALLTGRYRSDARARFMLGCLEDLDASLRARGSGLTVRRGRPEQVLVDLAREHRADTVRWTSDVAPYARARDARVTEALRGAGVTPGPTTGTYAVDVSVPRPQVVFSRFFREWKDLARRDVLPAPGRIPGDAPSTGVPTPADLGLGPGVPEPVRPPGETAARAGLAAWLAEPVDHYHERQDGMARVGTSLLAPWLRWGCLSAREAEAGALARGSKGAAAWRRQLAWRDFYAHTLLRHPGNVHAEQQERFAQLERDDDPDRLAAWAEGRTGFPLVDAGMRELRTTGFMHNRVRLVAGSLLTKELHLDHRDGERVFAEWLLCGCPAQNNGNWQWIAGTGTDPAPYFRRMYNPALHQQRFDPHGAYVRRWLPELAGVPDAKLAEPWTMTGAEQRAAGCVVGRDYPAPIVDRKAARAEAAERYRAVTDAEG
jgi:deoxyribodipyrimidine photo-lyase